MQTKNYYKVLKEIIEEETEEECSERYDKEIEKSRKSNEECETWETKDIQAVIDKESYQKEECLDEKIDDAEEVKIEETKEKIEERMHANGNEWLMLKREMMYQKVN